MKDEAKITNKKMATHLSLVRYEKRLTMRGLAQQLGTPHSFVGKIENQTRRLDIGEFIYYCNALELDPGETLRDILNL